MKQKKPKWNWSRRRGDGSNAAACRSHEFEAKSMGTLHDKKNQLMFVLVEEQQNTSTAATATDAMDSTDSMFSMNSMDSIDSMDSMDPEDSIESMDSMAFIGSMDSIESMESNGF